MDFRKLITIALTLALHGLVLAGVFAFTGSLVQHTAPEPLRIALLPSPSSAAPPEPEAAPPASLSPASATTPPAGPVAPAPPPEPVPISEPEPAPAPEPEPAPIPEPAPEPSPAPEPPPTLEPAPAPVPTPEPVPIPEPEPVPIPAPVPEPVPETAVQPKPATKPILKPAPKPAPKPRPKPAPKPLPAPEPIARESGPPPTPAPAPLPAPVAAPGAPTAEHGQAVAAGPMADAPAAPARTSPRADASWAGNVPPPYPWLARRLNEQGNVLLDIHVERDGRVGEVRLRQSSGFDRLDQAAIDTVRQWRFQPATVDGQPVAEWYRNWKWVFRLNS